MSALARWCYRHRWIVIALWIVVLVVSFGANRAAKPAFSTKFNLSGTQSTDALTLLQKEFPAVSGDVERIVVVSHQGPVTTPAVRQRFDGLLAQVDHMPYVQAVTSPYEVPGQISRSGTVAFGSVILKGQANDVPSSAVVDIIDTVERASSPGVQVSIGGTAIENDEPQKQTDSTIFGIIAALIVLGIAFGALFAAVLPLVTAGIAILVGYSLTGLLTHVLAVPSFATELGILIGLGVGVDYALFILTRHRLGLRAGRPVEESVVAAANTAGRAVFFAGLTVCIALLGQFVLGVSFLYGVAIGASLTVAATMVAALTLLPALLRLVGPKALSRRDRRRMAAEGPAGEEVHGFWLRWARSVERGPKVRAVIGLVIVVVIALPILTLRLGLTDSGSDPKGTQTRITYDALATGFGPGFNGPFQLVGEIGPAGSLAAFQHIVTVVDHSPGFVTQARLRAVASPSGRVAVANVIPTTGPQAAATTKLLHRLRGDIIPAAERGSGVTVLVTGSTALQSDFAHVLSSKLPLFVVVVVVLAFLLLMLVFRSILVPAVASVMNLLSIGAALGLMNAVFEWGWGHSLLGIQRVGPVEVFIPVLLFSILFGLSMDYEVFLVSRMHEEWIRSGDNRLAVTRGQAETGRVITAAAAIMILVFLSFVLGDNVIIKQFGVGLAGAIIVDAFVVRTLLVPSLMHLIGRANWWLPGWVDRALPQVHIEEVPEERRPPVGAGVGR